MSHHVKKVLCLKANPQFSRKHRWFECDQIQLEYYYLRLFQLNLYRQAIKRFLSELARGIDWGVL